MPAQLRRLHEQFEIDEFVGSRSDADFLQQPLPAASRRFAVGALARFWTALETVEIDLDRRGDARHGGNYILGATRPQAPTTAEFLSCYNMLGAIPKSLC